MHESLETEKFGIKTKRRKWDFIKIKILSEISFFICKKTFSIVLLDLVDAHYNFIAVDPEAYGKDSDGGVFDKSKLEKALYRSISFKSVLNATKFRK